MHGNVLTQKGGLKRRGLVYLIEDAVVKNMRGGEKIPGSLNINATKVYGRAL